MAHVDLIPLEAARAFAAADERLALTLLARARDLEAPSSLEWAVLERLCGLVMIHLLREVEGTFALERADALLDRLAGGRPRPGLELLDERLELACSESGEGSVR